MNGKIDSGIHLFCFLYPKYVKYVKYILNSFHKRFLMKNFSRSSAKFCVTYEGGYYTI